MAVVGADTHQTLTGVATGDVSLLEEVLGLREAQKEANGLDPRTFALVKIAALIALDAPPASYAWQVGNALNDGVSPEDILATLRAVAPQVGGPRVVAAAPETVVRPRVPTTAACRIRGDAPCLVTAIPISLPLTSEPSAVAAAPRLICDPQWWYGFCPAPS